MEVQMKMNVMAIIRLVIVLLLHVFRGHPNLFLTLHSRRRSKDRQRGDPQKHNVLSSVPSIPQTVRDILSPSIVLSSRQGMNLDRRKHELQLY
jgi:hypothetical protein